MPGELAGRRGVLFDVDGTLVDSSYVHTLCWWQAFRQQDTDIAMAEIHRSIGMGADVLTRHLQPGLSDDEVAGLTASHDALYAAYWPRLRPLPGARELVLRCHRAGLITVLASSAAEAELSVLLEVLDLGDAVDHVTHSDDADTSKPAPDIVAIALERAGLSVAEAVFIGDAVWDVKACQAIELACIGVESGGTSADELRRAGAIAVYSDPHDLLCNQPQLTRDSEDFA